MYQIGLLLLTGSFRLMFESITQYLKCANKNVVQRLYVKLEPDFSKPFTKSDTLLLKRLSDFVPLLYHKASFLCQNLDVRVILSDSKKPKAEHIDASKIDVILTNSKKENCDIVNYVDFYFKRKCDNIIKLHESELIQSVAFSNNVPTSEFQIFKTVCLGGTFDRIHNGHKVLLSEAALRATEKLIVGVTDGPMLKKKVLWELIEPVQKRIDEVTTFLLDVDPSLQYDVVSITDPYGPTITNPDINCIVVSAETKVGGERVNAERKKRGMKDLTMYAVDLVENEDRIQGEEEKLSSSTRRMHILGTCLKETQVTSNDFYVVLLQGQPLTGKSYISTCFEKFGAAIIYCNQIITSIFNSDSDLKEVFLHEFNDNIVNNDGSLDYKKLICLCLKDKTRRQWVADNLSYRVNEEIKQRLQLHHKEGAKLILIQDSLLLEDKKMCDDINELWSTVMSVTEIAKRMSNFYDLSEEDAINAAMSMPSNVNYLEKCHRAFCTQWSTDIANQQVSRAWSELKTKIM